MVSNGFGLSLFEEYDPLTGKMTLRNNPITKPINLDVDGTKAERKPLALSNGVQELDVVAADNGYYVAGRHTKAPSGNGYSIENKYIDPRPPAYLFERAPYVPPAEQTTVLLSNYQLDMMNNCYSDGTPRYTAGHSDRNISDKEYRQNIQNIQKLTDEVERLRAAGYADNSPEVVERVAAIEQINRILNPNYGVELLAQRAERKRAADEAKMHAETIAALSDLKRAMARGGRGLAPIAIPPSPGSSMGVGGLFGASTSGSGASSIASTPTGAGSPPMGGGGGGGAGGAVAAPTTTPSVTSSKSSTPPSLSRKSPPAKSPVDNAELFKGMFGVFDKISDANYVDDGKVETLPKKTALKLLNGVYKKIILMNTTGFTADQENEVDSLVQRIDEIATEVNADKSSLSKAEVQKIQTEIFNLQNELNKKSSAKSSPKSSSPKAAVAEAQKLYAGIPKTFTDIIKDDPKDGVKNAIFALGSIKKAGAGISVEEKWKSLLALILIDKGKSTSNFEDLYKKCLSKSGKPSKYDMTDELESMGINVDWTDYGLDNPKK